jgi:hypothetical protein
MVRESAQEMSSRYYWIFMNAKGHLLEYPLGHLNSQFAGKRKGRANGLSLLR